MARQRWILIGGGLVLGWLEACYGSVGGVIDLRQTVNWWTSGTGDATASASSGSTATGGKPSCGDGIVQAGEQCDGGGDASQCPDDCMCPKSSLMIRNESCDDLSGNSDKSAVIRVRESRSPI